MVDLREFGTRERVLGDVQDPLIPANEADPGIVDAINIVLSNSNKALKAVEEGKLEDLEEDIGNSGAQKLARKMTRRLTQELAKRVTSELSSARGDQESQKAPSIAAIVGKERELSKMGSQMKEALSQTNELVSLVDLKRIRLKGHFHDKKLSTNPILPRFHAAYGEPTEIQPDFVQHDKESGEEVFISKDSMRFLNRIDHIELDVAKKEVFVKDDFGIYIMYDCALSDMQAMEEEMLRIGTYYIGKLEDLYDTEVDKVCHKKDRQQVVNDLLNCEMDFQFKKVQLVQL